MVLHDWTGSHQDSVKKSGESVFSHKINLWCPVLFKLVGGKQATESSSEEHSQTVSSLCKMSFHNESANASTRMELSKGMKMLVEEGETKLTDGEWSSKEHMQQAKGLTPGQFQP